jgi:hypothetical protein
MTHQTVVIVLCVMCLGITVIVVERLPLGHKFPQVRRWLTRANSTNAFQVVPVYLVGLLWNSSMIDRRPWRGTFRIPRERNERCGIGEKNEGLREVLIGIDVSEFASHKIEWRKFPEMRGPRFLV